MRKINFFNIYNQDKLIHDKIISNISKSIKKNNFILTDEVKLFEKNFSKFCNTKYSIGVANGTDALYLCLRSLKLKKNDEVIIPAMTWKSTLVSVINNNLKPVLVDINTNNSNLNLNELKKKLLRKQKLLLLFIYMVIQVKFIKLKKLLEIRK